MAIVASVGGPSRKRHDGFRVRPSPLVTSRGNSPVEGAKDAFSCRSACGPSVRHVIGSHPSHPHASGRGDAPPDPDAWCDSAGGRPEGGYRIILGCRPTRTVPPPASAVSIGMSAYLPRTFVSSTCTHARSLAAVC